MEFTFYDLAASEDFYFDEPSPPTGSAEDRRNALKTYITLFLTSDELKMVCEVVKQFDAAPHPSEVMQFESEANAKLIKAYKCLWRYSTPSEINRFLDGVADNTSFTIPEAVG